MILLRASLFVPFLFFYGIANAQENPEPVCRILEKHTPANDVAYQPGVDAYGRAVVPADLNAQVITVPDVIKIPLNIDLAERMGSLVEGLDLEVPLGMLEISQDGRVNYNGEDWSAPMAMLCAQSHKVIKEPEMVVKAGAETPVEDRLETQDVIKSSELENEVRNDVVQEIAPVVAIPPQDIVIEQLEVDPPVDSTPESDVIEGGEHREIFFNE